MAQLSRRKFLKTLPEAVRPHLPESLADIQTRQPWRWLVQFHYGQPRLHYEVARAKGQDGLELGFHFEARDKKLNRYLLQSYRRHLFEIKDTLGASVEAEMWDRGWSKIYEVYPEKDLTEAYQQEVGARLAAIIGCLQPFFVQFMQRR